MIRLQKAENRDRELLWNINQKYLYEMTSFYDDPMDEKGNYHYGYFDEYFRDPKREAYLIFDDDLMVGFVFINPYSFINRDPDHVMAEFTIFPVYRRRHYGFEAAKMILAANPGRWEIKFNEKNTKARNLWLKLTEPYEPEVIHLNDEETVLAFTKED